MKNIWAKYKTITFFFLTVEHVNRTTNYVISNIHRMTGRDLGKLVNGVADHQHRSNSVFFNNRIDRLYEGNGTGRRMNLWETPKMKEQLLKKSDYLTQLMSEPKGLEVQERCFTEINPFKHTWIVLNDHKPDVRSNISSMKGLECKVKILHGKNLKNMI